MASQGWGQAVPVETWTYETVESVETTLRHYLAPAVLGADPSDVADVHARMERAIRPSFSVGQPLCKAAIDLACYDLWGKQTGRRVADLLGGVRTTEVKLSWTIQSPTMDAAEQQLEAGRARGLQQLQHQDRLSADDRLRPATRDARCANSRRTGSIGPTPTPATISTPRSRWRRSSRISAWKASNRRCRPTASATIRTLTRQGALPILMDEGIVSPVEVEEFIALEMFDGIAMKVARCGGLWNASRIATLLARQRPAAVRVGPDRSRPVARGVGAFLRLGRARPFRPRSTGRNTSPTAAPATRHSAPSATSSGCRRRRGSASPSMPARRSHSASRRKREGCVVVRAALIGWTTARSER